MTAQQIKLIVGLANPGSQYAKTRHNVGAWFIHLLSSEYNIPLKSDKKLHCDIGKGTIDGMPVMLAIPTTFMNLSGQAVQALAHYYKLKPNEILIAHDELDMSPGVIKLKIGGGNGGHNGLKDIHGRLSDQGTVRLRIGIGHPGHASQVSDYVLSKPSTDDECDILRSTVTAAKDIKLILEGQFEKVMNDLHRR
jgi:PTH1 family peptidyl-tRNA hydrolase